MGCNRVSQEQIENIKRRIAKLKRLSDGARKCRSFAEAEQAASMMQRLLDEYNLTMDSICLDDRPEFKNDGNFTHEKRKMKGLGRNPGTWIRLLRGTICRYCYCISLSDSRDLSRFEIVGSQENVSAALWLTEYLSSTFISLSRRRYIEHIAQWVLGKEKRFPYGDFRDSYLKGCVSGLADNFEANWKKHEDVATPPQESRKRTPPKQDIRFSQAAKPSPRALAVRTQSRLRDYLRDIKGKDIPKADIDSSYCCNLAWSLGLTDGRTVSLNRQIL